LDCNTHKKKTRWGKKTGTAEMKFFRSVAGYTMKDQIGNTKIREELNIFNLNNKTLISRSKW
jgi:hypothetical protein